MTKSSTVIGLGILVALVPFLGIPGSAKTVIFVIAGLLLVIVGYLQRRHENGPAHEHTTARTNDVFTENGDQHPPIDHSAHEEPRS